MIKTKPRQLNQEGFASIVIALILILVLALITIGFAQLARREQQNALSKQLSTQAFDAAESGINDIRQAIKFGTITDQPPTPTPNIDTETCLGSPWNKTIGPAQHGASYTCAIVNLKPSDLAKDPLSVGGGWMTSFTLSDVPTKMTIKWFSKDGKTTPRTTTSGFTPASQWNSPAVLQFSITPLSDMSRNGLINNTFNAYLYPASSGGSVAYDLNSQAPVAPAVCTASGGCSINLTGLPNSAAGYFIHLVDYYDDSGIDLTAYNGATQLTFSGSQAIIDVTGKAHNVLKRLRVRAPLQSSSALPNYSLEGQDLCKRFQTYPTGSSPDKPGYYTGTACDLN